MTLESDFHVVSGGVELVEREHVDDEGRAEKREFIEGHGAVFYDESDPGTEFQLGRYMRERISRLAFDGALKRPDDVRALFNHDENHALGRTNGTLRLSIDARGLHYSVPYDPNDADHKQVRAKMRKKVLTGSSFGFVVERETFEDDGDEIIRTIESVNPLIDVGPVIFPAFVSADSSIAKRKRDLFSNRLVGYIGEHRDEDIGRRLETRAAKFGLVIPKEVNPETIARTVAAARKRRLEILEKDMQRRP